MQGIVEQARYCIYQFDDKRDGQIIYIGLTDNLDRRTREHLRKDGLLYPLSQELRKEGLELLPSIIDLHSDLQEARKLEKIWIQKKKPLLNICHNTKAIYDRYEEEMYLGRINGAMTDMGLTYKEAILFVTHFCQSEGDHFNYDIICNTAQVTRQRLGLDALTGPEVLDLALEVYGVEQYER